MFELILELIIVFLITLLFVYFKKPNLIFLFFGYFSFLLILLITFPLKYLEYHFFNQFEHSIFTPIIITLLIIIISEISKYLTLKKFLRIKNTKSAILFGIGWTSLESINLVSILFYSYLFSFFSIKLNPEIFLKESFILLPFIFSFISNLAITTLVILSVIKKRQYFLFSAVIFAFLIYLGQIYFLFENQIYFLSILFISSIFILFKYNFLLKLRFSN